MNAPDPNLAKSEHIASTAYDLLMKSVMTTVKNLHKPWKQLKEDEQDQAIAQFDHAVKETVRKACDMIAADDRPSIKVTLKSVSFSADGVKGALEMPVSDDLRHELADAAGTTVILIPLDYSQAEGKRPKGEPEQKDLELGNKLDQAMIDAEKEAAAKAAAEAEELKKFQQETWHALHGVGFDTLTPEDVQRWTIEQITECRAYAEVLSELAQNQAPPTMPECLKEWAVHTGLIQPEPPDGDVSGPSVE